MSESRALNPAVLVAHSTCIQQALWAFLIVKVGRAELLLQAHKTLAVASRTAPRDTELMNLSLRWKGISHGPKLIQSSIAVSWRSIMTSPDVYERIRDAVIAGHPEDVEALVREALRIGLDPIFILKEGLVAGVKTVGKRFETGELFLCDLIMAGDAMTTGSELLRGAIEEKTQGKGLGSIGRVVMATVKDDIHDIGKNIVTTLLKVEGFEVSDLGKDVPINVIVEEVAEQKPNILGLSALLTTTMIRQREAIEVLKENGLRDKVRVMIGGAPTHEGWANEIGADGWAPDAIAAVKRSRELLRSD